MLRRQDVPAAIENELLTLIEAALAPGTVIHTIADGRPNTLEAIEPVGIWVVTERSTRRGGAELVPGWMFNVGWRELSLGRVLEARELVKVAKRSSAVCAVLAQLPEVEVHSSRPIRLALRA